MPVGSADGANRVENNIYNVTQPVNIPEILGTRSSIIIITDTLSDGVFNLLTCYH